MNTIPNTSRTLWPHPEKYGAVQVLDQRALPHQVVIQDIDTCEQVVWAIKEMVVRGAPLIAALAAYGVYYACREAAHANEPAHYLDRSIQSLRHSRPTAVNLFWAIDRQVAAIEAVDDYTAKATLAFVTANQIVEEDVERCWMIGVMGLPIIEALSRRHEGRPVNILTHCNAGRLGCIEWGTVTAPLYLAHRQGIPVHVWVDETRPRNQGAGLTAWELQEAGIPHTVIVDNAGGHLMQHGEVDAVIVGADRVTSCGDVANKIGTYLKALAAKDNDIPFYVALPSTTIDWQLQDGIREIPIEERGGDEVKYISGWDGEGMRTILLTPIESKARNYGFDVTPAALITSFITERGICKAQEADMKRLFSHHSYV